MKNMNRIAPRTSHWLLPAMVAGALAGMSTSSALAADAIPAAVAAPGAMAAPDAAARPAASAQPAIEPQADAILKRMGDYLSQAHFFSVNAEIWQDIHMASGQRIQAGRNVDLQVRRPDRLHAEMHSTRRNRGLYYDGKSLTLFNRAQNFYGVVPAPESLDAALDEASEKFGITMPLEDLIVSDPYRSAIAKVTAGRDVGTVTVLGVACEHLAFAQGPIDWQIWIETGAKPVPRKIVITYKDEEGSPQYTAIFSGWDFETKLPDFLFSFEAPAGASKIDVAELKRANQTHPKEGKQP